MSTFKPTSTTAASVFDTLSGSLDDGDTKSSTAATTENKPSLFDSLTNTTSTSTFGSNKPFSFGGFTSPPVQTVGSPGFGSPQTTTPKKRAAKGINADVSKRRTGKRGIRTSTTNSGLSIDKTIAITTSTTTPSGITAVGKSTGVMTTAAPVPDAVASKTFSQVKEKISKSSLSPEKKKQVFYRQTTKLNDRLSSGNGEKTSPVKGQKRTKPSKVQPRPTKKSRGSLYDIINILNDSGSEGEESNNDSNNSEDDNVTEDNIRTVRNFSKTLRTKLIAAEDAGVKEGTEAEQEEIVMNEKNDGVNEASERLPAAAPVDNNFSWSKDFSSFAGKKEVYLRVPGPTFSSRDPVHIFQEIWDHEFMEMIVRETNLYAWETIAQLSDPDIGTGIPAYMESWTDVTVAELYRYFAIIILLSFCYRTIIREYWSTGILGMPAFRNLMPRNRFLLINKFLHFVSNDDLSTRGLDRKVEKVAPVVDHCNKKFAALYTPSQHLSLDESLLLWKGRLSWKQCIRSKTARFGIKSFELCESVTGYLLQYRLYTGKRVDRQPDALHGFQNHMAKVVLDLIDGYLDVGHILVMDNWYNQLPLTRYLKTRHTDVLGTLSRQRQGIPSALKNLNPNDMVRGKSMSRHSGDISLVAWKDVKLVTIMSTYHPHLMVSGRRAGQVIQKPMAVEEYKKYMGGVDLKDQKLSMFLMERKRCQKWYIKVFKRLFNTSLLNAFIIYTRNPICQMYSHREFRYKIAEGILGKYGPCPGPYKVPNAARFACIRFHPGNHFPVYTEYGSGPRKKNKRLRCARCHILKKRVDVRTLCELCEVPLCLGKCWKEYHTVHNLEKVVKGKKISEKAS